MSVEFTECGSCIHSELDDKGSIFAPRVYICEKYGIEVHEDDGDGCYYYEGRNYK